MAENIRCDSCKQVVVGNEGEPCPNCGADLVPASEVPPLNEGDQDQPAKETDEE